MENRESQKAIYFRGSKKNCESESEKKGNVILKIRSIFLSLQYLFIKTEVALCNAVSIGNTPRAKTAKMIETFDFVENMRFLKNVGIFPDVAILGQELHFGRFRAEENKTMKLSPETQYRIALQEGQKQYFILDERLLLEYSPQ